MQEFDNRVEPLLVLGQIHDDGTDVENIASGECDASFALFQQVDNGAKLGFAQQRAVEQVRGKLDGDFINLLRSTVVGEPGVLKLPVP